MKLRLTYILATLILCCFSSCNRDKDKWKLPTDVMFTVDINRSETLDNRLYFDGGHIHIIEFSVDGKRDQGEDLYFEKDLESAIKVEFDPDQEVSDLDFDIPQGSYNVIEFEIQAEKDDDFSMVVNGNYTNDNGDDVRLTLQLESVEVYKVVAKDASGNSQIVLDKDVPQTVNIRFDPVHWFGTITTTMLESAEVTAVNGVETIVINGSENEDLYDLVIGRIDEKTEITFK